MQVIANNLICSVLVLIPSISSFYLHIILYLYFYHFQKDYIFSWRKDKVRPNKSKGGYILGTQMKHMFFQTYLFMGEESQGQIHTICSK